jgi:hypothetical protein
VIPLEADSPAARLEAARAAPCEIVAFLDRGAVPARNWLESTVPFLANPDIAAVVTATMTPAHGSLRERAAAAVAESRLGGGSHHFRFTPGNLRFVRHFPATNVVVRRDDLLALGRDAVHPHRLSAALDADGRRVLYTPETVVVAPRPPLFGAHLAQVRAAGLARGEAIRENGIRGITPASLPPLALLAFLVFGWPLAVAGGGWLDLWLALWAIYGVAVFVPGSLAALRFQSLRVGLLAMVGIVAVHVVYALGVLRGVLRRGG